MRRKILSFLGGILFFSTAAYCQVPNIAVSVTSLTGSLAFGDTSVATFVIKNIGNRDLDYTIDIEGFMKEFSKKIFSDWTLTGNQDLIVPGVSITRQNDQGIFNIDLESSYSSGSSPSNTSWVMGKTADHSPGDYMVWRNAVSSDPLSMLNNFTSMHVVDRDIYYDIFWKTWSASGNGGGFSYVRYEVPFWLKVLNGSGILAPTESDTIYVVFDGRVTNNTIREATIKVLSNDPDNAEVSIPASLTVSGDPVFELTKTNLEYSDTYIGTPNTLTFQIWNTGVGSLTISSITSSNTVFVPTYSNTALVTGQSKTVTVVFTPTAAQSYSDSLTITTNDASNPVKKVYVSGNGLTKADITVTPTSISKNVAYSLSHTYGEMDTVKLRIANPGGNNLNWHAYIRKNGTVPVLFEKTDYADYKLAANQDRVTGKVWLTRQNQQGLYNAYSESSYNDNSPAGTLWYDGLTGYSSPYEYDVSLRDVFGSLGNLPGNTVSMYLPDVDKYYDMSFLTWTQEGYGGGFSYSRVESVNWLYLSDYENTVSPSSADTILVLFNPQDFKTSYDAEIVIQSDVPGKQNIVVPVHYTVSGPSEIQSDNDNLNFGDVFITGSKPLEIRLDCMGASPLVVSSVTKTTTAFSVSATSFTINQDTNKVITITFTPSAVQDYYDTLVITSNALSTSPLRIPLYGHGLQPPVMEVFPTTLSHTLESGTTVTDTIVINNDGQSDLNWYLAFGIPNSPAVTFVKKDYADYRLAANQDRITSKVWLTRQDEEGLYNAALENFYSNSSPAGTFWYYGLTGESDPGDHQSSLRDVFGSLGNLPGHTLSMYLPDVKKYYDVSFITWTQSGNGGGLSYLRREAPIWLSASQNGGTVAPDDSVIVVINFDATMITAGSYTGQVIVNSNAPVNGTQTVTANLTVSGTPEIEPALTDISFDTAFIGYTKSKELVIRNIGSNVLQVTNIAGTTGRFVPGSTNLNIAAWDSAVVSVVFTPNAVQLFKDTLLISSNDPVNSVFKVAVSGRGLTAPAIEVTPVAINLNIFTDSVYTGQIIVGNTGNTDLKWALPENTLESVLLNLDNNYQQIIGKIPSSYNFAYDGGANNINDGGNDMYDNGNYLSTNLGSNMPYSNDVITDGSAYFGVGSRYFTRHLPGLFVLAADVNNIDNFAISGNNGADGSGGVEGSVLDVIIQNNQFQGFLKKVFNASDPSINQLVIIEKNTDVTQDYSTYSDNTYHQINGLNTTTRIYYLLYAGANGLYIDDNDASAIMSEFILTVTGGYIVPSWITFDKKAGTVATGESDTVNYFVDPTNLPGGTYHNDLYVVSNDPENENVDIPITIQYGSILVINSIADVLRDEGFGSWSTDFGNVFDDPQDDLLSYLVISSDENVVVAEKSGTTVTVNEAGIGTSIITIRASDGNGNVAYDDFNFDVNGLIKVINPVADVSKAQGFGTYTINLTNVFQDPDNDLFTISVVSGTPSVATVSVTGKTLNVTEVGLGTTKITLTADDGNGDTETDEFNFTVAVSGTVEPMMPATFALYPNPSEGTVNIQVNKTIAGKAVLEIYDISGQLVYANVYGLATDIQPLDLSKFDKGIYIITIRTSETEFKQKLILE